MLKFYWKSVLIILVVISLPVARVSAKDVVGWLEQVYIRDAGILIDAKVDTGADHSSVSAKILKMSVKDGRDWVRFRLQSNDGKIIELERQVERYASVKRKSAEPIERPVVLLGICLGKVYREVEVNLAERSNFKYQMLIGRSFLAGKLLVDSERRFSMRPECNIDKRGSTD